MSAPRRGRFITLEGGEGAGKSVQARRLEARLKAVGVEAVRTREPGGSPHAEALREVILSGFARPFGPDGEALLFAAARIDHLDATILPALERGAMGRQRPFRRIRPAPTRARQEICQPTISIGSSGSRSARTVPTSP